MPRGSALGHGATPHRQGPGQGATDTETPEAWKGYSQRLHNTSTHTHTHAHTHTRTHTHRGAWCHWTRVYCGCALRRHALACRVSTRPAGEKNHAYVRMHVCLFACVCVCVCVCLFSYLDVRGMNHLAVQCTGQPQCMQPGEPVQR